MIEGVWRTRVATGVCLACLCGQALANEGLRVSTGLNYSSGRYGGEMVTETWFMPLLVRYSRGRSTVKVSVPYIRMSGPGDVIGVGPDRVPAATASTTRRTVEGVGDVVVGYGYNLIDGSQTGWFVDAVGKVKLPTADKDKGLGTGEVDYSVQFDVARVVGAASVFGTVRWKKYGDPPGRDFRDPLYLSLGAGYRVAPKTTIGLAYDWRQKVSSSGSEISELSAFMSYRVDPRWKLQAYVVHGDSDASADWGGGLMVHRMID